MAETIYVRGEGGAIIAMDLPLPEAIQERFDRGLIQRVNEDGTPYAVAPAPKPKPAKGSVLTEGLVPRPGFRAGKDDWVLWAMAVHALPEADAQAMTKAQLQELPEQPTEGGPPAPGDGRPSEDATKAEWVDHVVKRGLLAREDAEAYTKDDLIDMVS
ncbi:hypothetical protein GCM10023084_05540 [Streptomyces lacrimifluminis]|uniref:Uncharacterized protein n=1 Tax=Streptomyces lacrimifluminis TaxID=1500077 RepID=A0A917NS39_9ACTN|nr:hypothetical protein [Streptomyces lacrimifluminis]GGJ22938.1 hypothetical protein GCM10012282_19280 [Streptomyces lacrimifluminis]